ncbi:MAG: hypothetical protein QOE70_3299 [Chthoniobacter sp.]|jgi:hypothetical protein|nr:hypothetical protein [Chthoniobacter sp.]
MSKIEAWRKVRGAVGTILGCGLFLFARAAAQDAAVVRAWLEPKSMRAPVTLPIAGAHRTEVALGRLTDEGVEPFSKAAFETFGQSREQLFAAGCENAAADLATLKPRYSRDRHQVIQYAEISSTRPIVASAVLAPKFASLFRDTLGDRVLVVVPNRYVAYVFPQLATRYQEYYPMVFEAYGATAYPVSVEVFEFSVEGIKAVGVYERP